MLEGNGLIINFISLLVVFGIYRAEPQWIWCDSTICLLLEKSGQLDVYSTWYIYSLVFSTFEIAFSLTHSFPRKLL